MNEAEAARIQAENAKLGPQARERVEAVERYLRASDAADLIGSLTTARQVENFERIIAAGRAQRAAPSPPPLPPVEVTPGTARPSLPRSDGSAALCSDADWQKMSHGERWAYARQFDQGQFQNSR
jgi:hypothetical protein